MPGTSFNIMSTYGTEDLLAIVTKRRNDYSVGEIEDAMNELKVRNIDISNLAIELERLKTDDTEEVEEDRKEVSMNIYMKILTFLLPFILTGVIGVINSALGIGKSLADALVTLASLIVLLIAMYRYIKKSGYIKMAKQFRNWIIISFIFCITLLLLEDILIALR